MIDIHSHILPGIDDGAPDLTCSIKMAKQAFMDGVTDIIATPHYIKGNYDNTLPIVIEKVAELNAALEDNNLPVKIYPGAELYLDVDLLNDIVNKKAPTLNNGIYVLIELPIQSVPHGTEEIIFKLLVNKYIPIIAHPERNAEFLQRPEKLYKLIEKGALTQMNAGSLLGDFGGRVSKVSKLFLQNKFIHFIGSDSHYFENRCSKLTKWIEMASHYVGLDYATDMVTTFPKKILDSKEIDFTSPVLIENEDGINKGGFLKNIFDRILG
ncbi:tyrosine protein phosphatase [Candidatus Dependentiae bacterium]|nr:tyrosine protein phosphatase [Candidatus Dependentiae bacterium]